MLERRDRRVLGAGIAGVILLAIITEFAAPVTPIEQGWDVLSILVIFVSLIFVRKGITLYGGEISRAMQFIGMGAGIYGLFIFPNVYLFIIDQARIGPVQTDIVETFIHTGMMMSFIVLAYGFYLLYQGGKEDEQTDTSWLQSHNKKRVLFLSVLAPFVGAGIEAVGGGIIISILLSVLTIVAGATSLVYIYKSAHLWGGQVARYLSLIGMGIAFYLVGTFPHAYWHWKSMPHLATISPQFWYILFHGNILLSFLFIGYGFYVFWEAGKER